MANLTEISIGIRKIGTIGVIGIISFFILKFFVNTGIMYYKATHQPPAVVPDIAFGKLPRPKFSDKLTVNPNLKYTLQNIEGKPPETTASARVFSMPKKSYSFESGEEAKNLAKKLGFESPPKIDTVYYYYSRQNEPGLSLFIDGTNLNFQYKYNYVQDPKILATGQIPTVNDAVGNVKNYLNYANLWDNSILNGKTTTEILTYDGRLEKMTEASSLSTAQAVRINFYRDDIDGFSLLPDEFFHSHNYALYAPAAGRQINNLLELSYVFWPIDLQSFGTYPLITGEEAYQALVSGNGMIANQGNNGDDITIRKIYLAYFDPATPQMYLQPIIVFEGDNNFVAYLPAVRPEYFN